MKPVSYNLKSLFGRVRSGMKYAEECPPVIGITANHDHADENRLTDTYVVSVRKAGGTPLIIPKITDEETVISAVSKCDGIILTGGGDLHPLWTESESMGKLGRIDSEKDLFDFTVIYAALRLSIPILGICRGFQMLNVALGGTLYEDIPSQVLGAIGHDQPTSRYETWHRVKIEKEGRLKDIFGGTKSVETNSFHHQAVRLLPDFAKVCATASDGVIEAADYYPEYNALGVQWHPEALACNDLDPHTKLFDFLVREAELYQRARYVFESTVVCDSHADTPTAFLKADGAVDFLKPSDDFLIDYPRMVDGGVHVATMVAWIPQAEELTDKTRADAADLAEKELEMTRRIMAETRGKVVLYVDPDDAWDTSITGTKGILLGIENGFAIGRDLSKLRKFQELGVQYVTLCHNGDNDICDSASKTKHTHGGLSAFGREVIREMNRLGITIDIAHAGDRTIEDILEISSQPIISSHSSCRALFDHPRNLPDLLMKAIADKGGVIQMCMYGGFLREKASEATIGDFCDHVMHAVEIAGYDHVGIGTDFDGDGEVSGCRHIGEFKRIAMELLRRGISEPNLHLMMGLNYLNALNANYHHWEELYEETR
ncbi:MAG: membrane dipeptidase [Porphyromonas sp.]|nr:membrane dipeptidase [Bacteroidales bacterium]MDY3100127.1 membrane dipeptidase [Porphyromonas sp.]